MNTARLRSKRVLVPAVAAVAALAVGGTVWAASADDEVGGDERARVAAAAEKAAGGGEAVSVETSDDAGEAYEVEVRLSDGTEVDVTLDQDLAVVGQEHDDSDDSDDADDEVDRDDADDRVLSAEERASVEQAALDAVGGGTLLEASVSDDPGVAYEADVRDGRGVEWSVDLDATFAVVAKSEDR
ncbi:PepSY domain-containing protein [Pimelobacter simplex]|uniref:PepSY domain-containing protein n=1 Tax=Nocardioides simplex TaxID=2045 RepID=UPI001933C58F|nr:PepSY domain-containing protein [Pimelobacter simplex]